MYEPSALRLSTYIRISSPTTTPATSPLRVRSSVYYTVQGIGLRPRRIISLLSTRWHWINNMTSKCSAIGILQTRLCLRGRLSTPPLGQQRRDGVGDDDVDGMECFSSAASWLAVLSFYATGTKCHRRLPSTPPASTTMCCRRSRHGPNALCIQWENRLACAVLHCNIIARSKAKVVLEKCLLSYSPLRRDAIYYT